MSKMRSTEFVSRAKNIAEHVATRYMWGTFGSQITASLIAQKAAQYPAYYSAARKVSLQNLAGHGVWAFDCVGLIKEILWGWNGENKTYGGAKYAANGVPDTNAEGMIGLCDNVTTAISASMPAGSLVWMSGHIGIYLGDGRVAECTLGNYGDGVVITNLSGRGWKKSGRLTRFIDYTPVSSVKGDVDGDGKVTVKDATLLSRFLAGWKCAINKTNAELDGDGRITVKDSTLLKRFLAGWKSGTADTQPHRYDYVTIRSGAKVYGTNRTVDGWVYSEVWQVSEIINGRAVLGRNRSGTNRLDTAFDVKDLKKI